MATYRIQFVQSYSHYEVKYSKCQCSFTLLTPVCIDGGVTSRSLSQVILNI